MNAPEQLTGRVRELDGLRGLLALWVLLSHIVLWCGSAETIGGLWVNNAVEAFYILSGFAISSLLCERSQTYKGFLIGRFFRVYPVYFVCLCLAVAACALVPLILETASWRSTGYFAAVADLGEKERNNPYSHFLAKLLMLHGVFPRQVLPMSATTFLPPAWSISVEWQYYLVAPLLARFARSGSGLLALSAVALIANRFGHSWDNPLPAFLPLMLPLFVIGIGCYHVYAEFRSSGGHRSVRYVIPVIACVACSMLVHWHSVALVIWGLACGSLFVEGKGGIAKALSRLRRALAHPWLQFLGKVSYPLYLVHWPVIIAALWLFLRCKPAMHASEAFVWMMVVVLPLIVGVAYFLHRFIEAPCMKFGRRLSGQNVRRPRPSGLEESKLSESVRM